MRSSTGNKPEGLGSVCGLLMRVMNASHRLPPFPHSRHGAISPLHFPHLFLGAKLPRTFITPQQEPGHLSLQFPSDPPTKTKPSCLRERPSEAALATSAGPGWTHGHLAPSFRNLWCALCHYTHGRAHPSIKFSSFLTQTFWTYLERSSSGVKISLSNLLLVCDVVERANFIRPAVI